MSLARKAPHLPWTITITYVVMVLQTTGLIVLTVWMLAELLWEASSSAVTGGALILLAAVAAVFWAIAAAGIRRGRRWARSAGVFTQLLLVSLAAGSALGEYADLGISCAVGLPSLAAGLMLFTPSADRHFVAAEVVRR